MSPILQLIKTFNLENYLSYFLSHNSAVNAPYHNFFHTCCVMENCYKIGRDEGLHYAELRILLIAALFHDFGHTQGEKTDKYNVQLARKKFMEVTKEDDEDNIEIIEIILATEYPYTINDEDLSLAQKIIRDADLMQLFEKNFLQQVWIGLFQDELKKTPIEGVNIQLKFIKSLKFYTNYAKQASEKLLQSRIESFEFIKKLIDVTN